MKSARIAVALLLPFFAGNVWAETVKMRVDGLVCAFCGSAIEKKLKSNSATADVLVSLENKIVAVRFKDGQNITDEVLKAQINDAGYEVKTIERSNESIEELRKALKLKRGG